MIIFTGISQVKSNVNFTFTLNLVMELGWDCYLSVIGQSVCLPVSLFLSISDAAA